MNFYKRHLGDYAKDAGHLTMLEHGAFTLLLDRYYATEQPIPQADVYRVTRAREKADRAAVDAVLGEFFTLVDGFYVNKRAESEIAKAAHQRAINQETGKKGGRPPKANRTETESVSVQNRIVTEQEPYPDSTSQTPDSRTKRESATRPSRSVPEGFEPDAAFALSEIPGLDVAAEIAKFRDCEFKTPHRDWAKVWRNWVRRCKESGQYAKAGVGGRTWQ